MKFYDKHFPLVNVKNHYVCLKKTWITKEILKSRKTKNKLYRKFLNMISYYITSILMNQRVILDKPGN